MAQYMFGSGSLFGVPTADAAGAAITNPSPVKFGVLQDVSLDVDFETKMLHGQLQFPVSVARGKGKIGCKAKFGQVNGALFNSLFFGQTLTNGTGISVRDDIVGAAIPTTPFTITPTPPSSGTWVSDLGVTNSQAVPLTRVASAPTTGQYSVAAGVYTFAGADVGVQVFINFRYSFTLAAARNLAIISQPMGYTPTFRAELSQPYQGRIMTIILNNCVSKKLGMSAKNDDFTVPELEFEAFSDANGSIMTMSLSE